MSSNPGPDLSRLWGIVQRAVRDPELRSRPGGVVQNIWASYQQAYLSAGEAPPTLGVQQVNRLVSTAFAQVRAESELARSTATFRSTGMDQAITAAHIAPDIDTRAGVVGSTGATFRVRFQYQVNVEGEALTRYLTWTPALDLPSTVGDLMDALEEAALAAAEDYGEDFGGLGDLASITAV